MDFNSTKDVIADAVNSDTVAKFGAFFEELSRGGEGGHGGHEHHGHAHSGHAGHGGGDSMAGHHMMKMWFHGGCEEVILFDFWRIDSCIGLLVSCVLIFVMGALYEGVKWFRVYLQLKRAKEAKMTAPDREVGLLEKNNEDPPSGGYVPSSTPPCHSKRTKGTTDGPFSLFRLAEALLYSLQLILAYWLMLIVMTYNTWLTVAVIAGAAFGHWIFAILNLMNPHSDGHDSFTTDACH